MKKNRRSKYRYKSIINKLLNNNIINESNLTFIDSISLEDLIAVKLELSAKHINNKLYAFNLLSNTNRLVKEAIIKFAISATNSKMDAARFLGTDYETLHSLVREYNLQEFFDEINN
jgi:transcriptional regulator with GAF, ATPase, and Fis domain|tara:strand:+ start:3107 stop:3457 length:351 start_codon:yes stop_codon:yes gene_type:complete